MTPDELAKKNGFDYAQYIGEVNGVRIYCGAMEDPNTEVGWPQHIIEMPDGTVRMATPKENDKLMDMFPYGADDPPEDDEEGE